jgi:hypothetical protein
MNNMLIKKYILPCLILSGFAASGQNDSIERKDNFLIAISGGVAFPVFNFRLYEVNDEERKSNFEGPAKIGYNGRISIDYFLSKKYGLSLDFGAAYNKAAEVNSSLLYYNQPTYSGGLGGGTRFSLKDYDSDYWLSVALMLGFVGRKKFNNHYFAYKISGGLMTARSPKTIWTESLYHWRMYEPPSYGDNVKEQPAIVSYGPAIDAHIDWQFPFGKRKKFSALISIDYITSHNTFKKKGNEDSLPWWKDYEYNFTKNINQLLINFGLVYSVK